MEAFFRPRAVAVVGASEKPGKVGRVVLENILRSGFTGKVYPVNPNHEAVLGLPCYASVSDLPETPDLAVIIVPAPAVREVVEECGTRGVAAAVIITAGFKESGREGYRREIELRETARRHGIRVLGPNCLGLADTFTPLNATFATRAPLPGNVAFMSQSGALCTAVLGWSEENHLGFSRFISLGNKMDVDESDVLEELERDTNTAVIAAYLEGVKDGERFLEVAARVGRSKPVIVLKAGVTQAGARAVSSHTGTLAGSEKAYNAAFRRCGALRAETVEDLFMLCRGFSSQPPPRGPRVGVITNAGGPGIIASDALERSGLALASLSEETATALREGLPEAASVYNPVDVLGDAGPERYRLAVSRVLPDPGVDALLVILTPQAMTEVEETARVVAEEARGAEKTVFAVFMGGEESARAEEILREAGIPNFRFPEEAVRTLRAMREYTDYLARPRRTLVRFDVDRGKVRETFDSVLAQGRKELVEVEAREVLNAYGLPVARTRLATNLEECIRAAREIGYPVVVKIASPLILHKTDVGGVVVGIRDTDELVNAYEAVTSAARKFVPAASIWGVLVQEMLPPSRELIVGMSRDAQFGPLLMIGLGGIYVEVLGDVSFRLAPVSEEEAAEMLRELKSYGLLKGARGEKAADIDAVVESILRISQLVLDFPEIAEMDINPLRVLEEGKGCLAADARIVLKE
ncbi:acetate--CoA ligase alpha subunit [Candidatus Solincola sp.]|nr:acetate--CoA ligase family protein [Actinomycetota bacterium]MDI7252133.1 acetate--CoA ligase family protein [Actinomycetota bacterium]